MPVTHMLTGRTEIIDFYISSTQNQALLVLGVEACLQFELLRVNHDNICALQATICRPLGLEHISSKYPDLFEGYGKLAGTTVHLAVDPASPPVRMPLRKLPVAIKEKVAN